MTDWLLPFLCGLGASIISAWGVGGGTLLLLVMTLFLNVDQRTAQGLNLLFFLPIALISVIMHIRAGFIDKKLVISLIPGGILGAVLGTVASSFIGNDLLRKIYAVFLLIFGLRELFKKAPRSHEHNNTSS